MRRSGRPSALTTPASPTAPATLARRRGRPRLTLRGRLTTLFALGTALLVLSMCLLLVAFQSRNSDQLVTKGLRQRIDRIVESFRSGGDKLPATEIYAQVFTQFGTVKDLSSAIGADEYLLTPSQQRFVFQSGSLQFDRSIPALGGHARLLAEPRSIDGTAVVIVVGSSLVPEAQSRRRLLLTLAVAAPALVMLLGLAGWWIAGAALRPVRRMTDEAAAISHADTGIRLPLPAGTDEIAHLGSTLNAMLDRLESSFRRERAFVDDASHELRTPLAILRGELELGLLHPGDAAETRRMLTASIDEVDRLSRLADDLLVLARAGSDRSTEVAPPIDLLAACERVVNRLRPALRPELDVSVEGRACSSQIRPDQFERALTNLMANGNRFAAQRIEIHVTTKDATATVAVADDGQGFPPGLLERAFERFTVGNAARTRAPGGGTGIGLAIVKAIMERHGGTVSATNGPTGGAVVALSLPLVAPEIAAPALDRSASVAAPVPAMAAADHSVTARISSP